MVRDNVTDNAPGKAICARCPERSVCLAYAEDTGATWGVWGGESFFKGSFE
jgi:WhiB family transcriptional regulator, redox-sensing transcriptional regulator